ncbi:MAG: DNA translocase FtsK 4TM domain-containing protein [Eubacteriales bacterium]|nr:DNA translocase FtsK 4TM domain-containing protein [Eubacteriales bacterium]
MPRGKKTKPKRKPAGEIGGIICIAVGIFLGVCVFIQRDTGLIGGAIKDVLFGLFGLFAYLVPFAFVIVGILIIASRNKKVNKAKVWLSLLLVISVLSLTQTFILNKLDQSGFFSYVADSYRIGMQDGAGSGAVGCLLVYPFNLLIGDIGCVILFITTSLISVLALLNLSIKKMGQNVAKAGKRTVEKAKETVAERKKNRLYIEDLREEQDEEEILEPEILGKKSFFKKKRANYFDDDIYRPEDVRKKAADLSAPDEKPVYHAGAGTGGLTFETYETYDQDNKEKAKNEEAKTHVVKSRSQTQYAQPPTSLLSKPAEKSKSSGMEEQRRNALLIEETLANFGVEAQVVHIVKGPAVTRYELRPAPGVRVKRIKELENDLAMNLAAKSVKIEAPIPGKAAVGVEVPNSDVTFVHLRTLLETEEFRKAKSPLTFALGKDISGKNYYVDITKMPHILIAGETGSGKSVCINSLLTSILFKATPEEVKMILIDPKVVELSVFKKIPHLLVPVVTDTRKAASALNWGVSEMTSRYKLFAESNVRNITRFNEVAEKAKEQILPRIIVVVDELAELMLAAPREVEDAICRIAQLGRAAGIHLVIATQRPSVNVITGVIKANISSRIAFKVNSGVDSRTILDQHGAEKLLRNGDMLYHPSDAPKTVRLQGCFVSDSDIEAVTEYVSGGSEAEFDEEVVSDIVSVGKDEATDNDDYDELLPRAVGIVLEYGQASISMLQRRLRVGYARAARLVDEMELRQIVSPFEGSKARQVLISWDTYEDMFGPREG